MSRLLIMACSATKSSQFMPMPAVERYTGTVWQTLKAADPTGALAHVTVLSAEHGWIDGSTPICKYNRKMDHLRGHELIQRGVSEEMLMALAQATGYAVRPFTEVCIVGGHYYQGVARELVRQAYDRTFPDYFDTGFRVLEICDQVGYMRQKLRAWLAAGAEQEAA